MKTLISLLITLNFAGIIYAQGQLIEVSHYLFPKFSTGSVLLKTGEVEEYPLNFNSLTEQIIFQRSGVYLEIAKPETVDTIYIQSKKFVPVEKVYYEILLTTPIEFYVEHKCTLIPPGKPAGYGGTSETGAATSITTLTNTGKINQLKLPDEYKVSPYMRYWIKKDNNFLSANSAKQIAKILPEKADAIKKFVKANKTNFKKTEDVEKLILSLQ